MRTDLDFPRNLPDFMRLFPDDAACAAYLERLRWRDGFTCPKCGHAGDPYRFERQPGKLRCRKCQKDTWLMAGTVMERSHSPLSVWFWGAYLVSSLTPGMSAVQFQRQLGLTRYETAFQILHKLRAGMVDADRTQLGPRAQHVEVDETWVGGRERGVGRGNYTKTLVVGAIEARRRAPKADALDSRHNKATPKRGGLYAGRLRLSVVPNRQGKYLQQFVRANVESGATVVTDGWRGYAKLIDEYEHIAAVEGDDDARVAEEYLPLIHLIFSNLKAWLNGVHHGVGQQHLQAYLNEFVFRFNRRFLPFNAFKSLLGIGTENESPTYEELYSKQWLHPNQVTTPRINPEDVIK